MTSKQLCFPLIALRPQGRMDLMQIFSRIARRTLKEDTVSMATTFFPEGILPDHINDPVIALIPKVDHPCHLKDFRPIALCNVDGLVG